MCKANCKHTLVCNNCYASHCGLFVKCLLTIMFYTIFVAIFAVILYLVLPSYEEFYEKISDAEYAKWFICFSILISMSYFSLAIYLSGRMAIRIFDQYCMQRNKLLYMDIM